MRFRLRTLLILLAVGPPILAAVVATATLLLQWRRDAAFADALYKAEATLHGLDLSDEPSMLSMPPSD